MSWAMKSGGSRARTTLMTIKATIRHCISTSWVLSFMFFTRLPLIKSRVRVELEVSTREERVDMDADSTSMTTIPINRSGRPDSMAGMMVS